MLDKIQLITNFTRTHKLSEHHPKNISRKMTFTTKEEGETLTGILAGRLDTIAAAQFEKDMQPLMDNANKQITLDLTDLEYISSSGLRLLLTLRKQTMAKGGSVAIAHINNEIRQIFTITGFIKLFDFKG